MTTLPPISTTAHTSSLAAAIPASVISSKVCHSGVFYDTTKNADGTYAWPKTMQSPLSPLAPLPTFPPLQVVPPPMSYVKYKQAILKVADEEGWNIEPSKEDQTEEESMESMHFILKYFHEHPDLVALYTNPDAIGRQCPVCNKTLGGTLFDVYTHAKNFRSNQIFIDRGVAEALLRLYNNEEPPRSAQQLLREQTRPNRRPASRR